MQLIIESESISHINMSTLEETQDKQNAVVTDIKKDIQSLKDDLHKEAVPNDTAEKETDGEKQLIIESQTNGDVEISNETEIPNDDKENDAPKMDISLEEVSEEESIENITNCVNSLFGLAEDSNSGNLTEKVNTDETSLQNDPKIDNDDSVRNDSTEEGDIKMEIDNGLDHDNTVSPSAQSVNDLASNILKQDYSLNEKTKQASSSTPDYATSSDMKNEVTNQDSVKPAQNSELPLEIETPEKMEVDTNCTVESTPSVEENTNLVEETIKNSTSEDINLSNDAAGNNAVEIPLEDKVIHDAALYQKSDENSTESTLTPENDINLLNNDSNHTNDNIANNQQSSELSVASPSEQVVESDTAPDVVLAPSEKDNNVTENETSHITTLTIDSSNDVSDDKLDNIENNVSEIDVVSIEKDNDITKNAISVDNNSTINSNKDISEDKLADNKIDAKDIDHVPCEKVVDNVMETETSYKHTPIDSTNSISEEKIPDNKKEDSSIEKLSDNKEKMSDIISEDVTDTTSIKEKEINSTDIGPKESEKVENVSTKTPDTEDKKDSDRVSISSMEVDDVEVVPEKDNTENKEIKKETVETSSSNSQNNNVIEILDIDSTETKTAIVDDETKQESLDTKPEETFTSKEVKNKNVVSDEDDIKIIEESKTEEKKETAAKTESTPLVVCKLSNTLDILSDDDEEPAEPPAKKAKIEEKPPPLEDKQCINIDDDDDIVLIEDTKESPVEPDKPVESDVKDPDAVEKELCTKETETVEKPLPNVDGKDVPTTDTDITPQLSEKEPEPQKEAVKEPPKPLLPMNVLKSAKKNLSEMTRDELEEFCILKIVESIVDRSSLSEIKKKIKVIEQNMEEYKKKAMMLSKQNRDLQVVLKSVQEEQKNRPSNAITPLKITRSVGMQVLMFDKTKKKPPGQNNNNVNAPKFGNRTPSQPPKTQKPQSNNQNIPVPKLIPASPAKIAPMTNAPKPPTPNGIRNTPSPAQKSTEKRPLTRQSIANTSNANNNMTVDLTDDDPPAKVTKSSPIPPVRLVPPQNLMAPRTQTPASNPRKVFIPINGPGQTVILKNINQQQMGPRGRFPAVPRMPQNQVRMAKVGISRHPAPLPDVTKQYQPPTWKALPPAPDLKLSKVENGIVISWKIEGYQEESYEKIASYQLYAYQETSTPPSTALWKKIGDVKALPLPMACTLTQFMAGFKYYFAVRAVDVKSRLGPFSLPGSILLLNKM